MNDGILTTEDFATQSQKREIAREYILPLFIGLLQKLIRGVVRDF